MQPKALDRLQSQEDRAAVAEAVGKELAPPRDLSRIYGRLVFESRQAQMRSGEADSELEQMIAKATAEQVDWLGGEFRHIFLADVSRMLQWCHRLQVSHPTQEWSPDAWVSSARDLEAEAELLCLVITKADTLSWDSWIRAFSRDQDWPAQWFGWENAFSSAPRLASRWLETILSSDQGIEDSDRISRLSFSRGRIWQKIHVNQAAGRPVEILSRLDGILEEAGALRALSSVDFTTFLKKEGRLVSPSAAREALEAFLKSSPEDACAWLSSLTHPSSVPVKLAADRPDLRGLAVLSWMASQGECAANQVQEVFDQWATLLDDADWMLVMDKSLLAVLGVEVPEEDLEKPPVPRALKGEKKKQKVEERGNKGQAPKDEVDSSPIAPSAPSPKDPPKPPPSEVPLEAIPRFSQRK